MGHIGRESVDTKGLVSLTSDVPNEIWKIRASYRDLRRKHSGQRGQQGPGCNQRGV